MPRKSRKRYPPREVDISESIDFEELANALEPTSKQWAEMPPADRSQESTSKLEAVSRLIPPDLSDPDAAEYFNTFMPSHIIEPETGDGDEDALLDPFTGSITGEEFERLVTTIDRSKSLSTLERDYDRIEYIFAQHVVGPDDQHSRPFPWFFDGMIDPVCGPALTREAIVFRFLQWLYEQINENTEAVPDAGEMAHQLVAVTNQALTKHRGYFELRKREAYEAVALAIVRSLTSWGVDEDDEDQIYEWISDRQGDLVRPEEYDPLSKPDLRALIERIAKELEGNPHAGIGDYTVSDLREIFEPRELVVLEACGLHWSDECEWPWNEVLKHRRLGLVMNENMLSKTSSKVKSKLKQYPDLAYSLLDIAWGAHWGKD